MKTLTMTKTPSDREGGGFLYQVHENGKPLVARYSHKDYVACAVTKLNKEPAEYVGQHYFAKLELIGKGDSRAGFEAKSWYAIAYINPPSLFV